MPVIFYHFLSFPSPGTGEEVQGQT
jgi:hypothetical protein